MKENWTNAILIADTTNMSNEEWTYLRSLPNHIGGSDQGAINGVSPFVSIHQLYDEKCGLVERENLSKDAFTTGHIFEAFVAMNFIRYMKQEFPNLKIRILKDFFRDFMAYAKPMFGDNKIFDKCLDGLSKIFELNKKSWGFNPNGYYQCGQRDKNGELLYPFAYANLDGIVELQDKNGELRRGIFEAKTTNSRNKKVIDNFWKKGICPPYYYYQVLFYMEVMELDFAYITCCWGLTLDSMAVVLVERDKFEGKMLMELNREFLKRVELGLSVDDLEKNQRLLEKYYKKKYGLLEKKDDVPPVELPLSFAPLFDEAVALNEEIEKLEEELEEVKERKIGICNKFYPYLKNNNYATLTDENGHTVGFSLKIPYTSPKFNQEKFKKEHPKEYREVMQKGKGKWAIANLRNLYPIYENLYTPPKVIAEDKPIDFKIYNYEDTE